MALPEGTGKRIQGWAEAEEAEVREREALVGELSQAMLTHGHDPTPIREAWGG